MKQCLLSTFFFLCTALWLHGQFRPLSPAAEISLLTVAPGAEIYSTFGHTALHVYDSLTDVDKVYNYGTFDFETPNFTLTFLQGKLLYYLNPESYRQFEYGNLMDERTMVESTLNLNQDEKQRMYTLLETNLLPENRAYKYDFFYDNCATRIRDITETTFMHLLTWDSTQYKTEDKTMRELLRPYMEDKPWTWFGMQLILGVPTDAKARLEDYMFLPDHLRSCFNKTEITPGRPLISSEKQRPQQAFEHPKFRSNFFISPLFGTLCLAFFGLMSLFNDRFARIFDRVFWVVLGLFGLLVALLWLATDHSTTKLNLNILWAWPTHLLVFWRSRLTSWVDLYYIGAGSIAALFMIFFKFLPQGVPLEVLPILALIVVKGIWGAKAYAKKNTHYPVVLC